MNYEAINHAIKELEDMADLLHKISKKEISQKQAADKLGITPQNFSGEIKNSFANYFRKKDILTEDMLLSCLGELQTPCEKIAKEILGINDKSHLVIVEAENEELFMERMKEILSEREYLAMSLRFGIGGKETLTLDEIGEQLGVKRERARQILSRALRRLRNPANCKLLLPNYTKYAKALDNYQEAKVVSDRLESQYNTVCMEYTWLLHKQELTKSAPELRRQLEMLVQMSDLYGIPEDWKVILASNGIHTVFDYIEADREKLESIKEYCPDFSCAVLDSLVGITQQEAPKQLWNIPIEELNLSVRAYNALYRARIDTIGELALKSKADLKRIRNLGRSCLEEIEGALKKYHIVLAE